MSTMADAFDHLASTGTFGDCDCSSLNAPLDSQEDIRCPNPANIITPEGWTLCQAHAELIDACANIMAAPAPAPSHTPPGIQ